MSGEFEKKIKKMNLDPKFEKELLAMFNQASSEDPCINCASKEGCENFKWHKKYLNTGDEPSGCTDCNGCCP